MRKDYTNQLTKLEISTNRELEIKVIRVQLPRGEEQLRLYVVQDDKLRGPIQFPLSELKTNIMKLNNYGKFLKAIDIYDVCKVIENKYNTFQVIPYTEGIGWQVDEKDEIQGYVGVDHIDKDGTKRFIDEEGYHLQSKGNIEKYIKELKSYMSNPVREAIFTLGMTAVICGLLKKNIVVCINAKSRSGKSTVAKLCLSSYSNVKDKLLYKTFNATGASLMESMKDINGACVLIDDTSLWQSNDKFTNLIYSLESGKEKGRYSKKDKPYNENKNIKENKWYTTTILTSEESILFNCNADKEGVMGRLIELAPTSKELFDNAEQANKIQELYENHYGLMGTKFAEYLIENGYIDRIEELYKEELMNIREAGGDQQMNGILENIAVVKLTAELLNKAFNLELSVEEMKDYLVEVSKHNLEEYREEQTGTRIMEELYPKLIEFGQQNYSEHTREDGVWIEGKAFKKFIKDHSTYKVLDVKRELRNRDLLVSNVGAYGYNITRDKKSVAGICIQLPKGDGING